MDKKEILRGILNFIKEIFIAHIFEIITGCVFIASYIIQPTRRFLVKNWQYAVILALVLYIFFLRRKLYRKEKPIRWLKKMLKENFDDYFFLFWFPLRGLQGTGRLNIPAYSGIERGLNSNIIKELEAHNIFSSYPKTDTVASSNSFTLIPSAYEYLDKRYQTMLSDQQKQKNLKNAAFESFLLQMMKS